MALFQQILFPTDFSERSAAVAPAVAAYASHFQAHLTLLYAFETPIGIGAEVDGHISGGAFDLMQSHVHQKLNTYLGGILPANTHRVLAHGHAAHTILTQAKQKHADLIMMPTHGHTRFRQLLLGSTTAAVLHDAECAVWTSAHAEIMAIPEEVRRVVCAIDLSEASRHVLRFAKEVADGWGASLSAVHAVPGIDPRYETAIADRAHNFLVASARDKFPAIAEEAGVEIQVEIMEQLGLGRCLAEACRRHEADLLVIGRGAIHGFLGRLRSNAHEIIRYAPCPVLSV